MHTASLGQIDDVDNGDVINMTAAGRNRNGNKRLGARKECRTLGSGGGHAPVPRGNNDASHIACVMRVADKFAEMSDTYVGLHQCALKKLYAMK